MTSKLSNKFPIPEKFPEILHDFAKEVVRAQPNDIFDFAVEYFRQLEQVNDCFQKGNNNANKTGGSFATNEPQTNENTKTTNFGLKKEEREFPNVKNYDVIVEGEGDRFETEKNIENGISHTQSEAESQSNSVQRELVVKEFINDVFKKSEEFVNVTKRKGDSEESEENEGVAGHEDEVAKYFVGDILKKSGEGIRDMIHGMEDATKRSGSSKSSSCNNSSKSEKKSKSSSSGSESESGTKGHEDEIAKNFVCDILKKSGENVGNMLKNVETENEYEDEIQQGSENNNYEDESKVEESSNNNMD